MNTLTFRLCIELDSEDELLREEVLNAVQEATEELPSITGLPMNEITLEEINDTPLAAD